jgi:pimeloyl-ACP methyl ester carboxylesterase
VICSDDLAGNSKTKLVNMCENNKTPIIFLKTGELENIIGNEGVKAFAIKNKNLEEKLCRFGSKDYRVLSPVMKQTFVNVVNEDLSHDAKFIKTNTIIVWGDKDKETKAYMARKLKRLINGSKLYFLKGAGHFSFLEKKEE